jgi:hypothetical protein
MHKIINYNNLSYDKKTRPFAYILHNMTNNNAEVHKILTSGYITIHKSLYDHIPIGSRCRYMLVEGARICHGGYVKAHIAAHSVETDGVIVHHDRMFLFETVRKGSALDPIYTTFPVAYNEIAELWKKYPYDCIVEMHLIYASLAKKNKQIAELMRRVTALEKSAE